MAKPIEVQYKQDKWAGYNVKMANRFTISTAIIFQQLFNMAIYLYEKEQMELTDAFYMPYTLLEKQTALSRPTIKSSLDTLADNGLIVVYRQYTKNFYTIEWEALHDIIKAPVSDMQKISFHTPNLSELEE